MKKLSALAFVLFLSSFVIAPSALAADCTQGYLQYSDGTYTNADGTACTPGANSGTAANASLFATQGNPQPTGATSAFVPIAPIPGLTQGVTANQTGLANFFNNLYKYAIGLAAELAVIMIVWGGLEISTQDSISKQGAGREKIYNAIFGLVLVLSPVLVFSIINPAILNLSLNLPALKTASTPPVQAPTLPGTTSFTNVGTNVGSNNPVQVGDKIINLPTPGNTSSITQYQAAITAAKTDCQNAGGTLTTSGNPDNTVTLKCSIPVK